MAEKLVLDLGTWDGDSQRSLFWCACFDTPCEVPPRLCFDKDKTSFAEIKPEVLMGDEVVGKILRLRIKEHGVTCTIEVYAKLRGNYRHPEYDYPWDFLKFISFKSHLEDEIEIIDHLVIDERLVTN